MCRHFRTNWGPVSAAEALLGLTQPFLFFHVTFPRNPLSRTKNFATHGSQDQPIRCDRSYLSLQPTLPSRKLFYLSSRSSSAPMAPSKSSRNGHDDSKAETPSSKEKNGHSASNASSNGKMRRVASSAGSNLREVTSAPAVPPPSLVVEAVHESSSPGVCPNPTSLPFISLLLFSSQPQAISLCADPLSFQ